MQKRTAKKFLTKIQSLNRGGCLVSAYAVQQFCIKNNLRVPHLVALHNDMDKKNCEVNSAYIESNGNGEANSAAHFGYSYGTVVYDSDGIVWTPRYKNKLRIPLELSTDFYKKAMNAGNWNPKFDRKNIPVIAEKFGVDLAF